MKEYDDEGRRTTDDILRIKDQIDTRSVSRAQTVIMSIRFLLSVVVIATLWFARLEYNLMDLKTNAGKNRAGLELLWEKVFGYKMPP